MEDKNSDQSINVWPLPKFHFEVKWDSEVMSFQEVSGLDREAEPIEYRHGDSPEFSTIKIPGIKCDNEKRNIQIRQQIRGLAF